LLGADSSGNGSDLPIDDVVRHPFAPHLAGKPRKAPAQEVLGNCVCWGGPGDRNNLGNERAMSRERKKKKLGLRPQGCIGKIEASCSVEDFARFGADRRRGARSLRSGRPAPDR
jgi:hypothetical protein